MTDDRENRLPVWARHELSRLRANENELRKTVAAAIGEAPTRIEVDPYHNLIHGSGIRNFIPERHTIRITVPGGTIDVALRHDAVQVTGHTTDHKQQFVILPDCSNVVFLSFARVSK